jgi:hypothetical protein
MKNFLASGIFVFLGLSATLTTSAFSCDMCKYIKDEIILNLKVADQLENELWPYINQKDYELGFYRGRISAFNDMIFNMSSHHAAYIYNQKIDHMDMNNNILY